MLKTLTVAILLGLTSGRPSIPSGQEISVLESRDLIYIHQEFPKAKNSLINQLEEIPNLQAPLENLLRGKRDVETNVMDFVNRLTVSLTNAIMVPTEALSSLISNLVESLVEAIFGLVADILNPILELLAELLDPILEPLRPLLDPILLPLDDFLTKLFSSLHLPIDLSGLLTGNTTSMYLPAAIAPISSSDSSSEKTELSPVPTGAQIPPTATSGASPGTGNELTQGSSGSVAPGPMAGGPSDPGTMSSDLSQSRRRRSISPFSMSNLVITPRIRRQSIDPTFGSALGSIASVPSMIISNILSAIRNVILFPFKMILTPIFSFLHLPIDLISLPFNLIDSILSNIASPINGIIDRIEEPTGSLLIGLIDLVLALAKNSVELGNGILSIPRDMMNEALKEVAESSRRRRDAGNAVSTGPLNVFLSLLSGSLDTLFSYLPSLLDRFNISYPTLQEDARVFFSNAANRFLVTAYNVTKNVILPGVDELLQSIVGSPYIPDYLNSAITQFHTIYKLVRMMGYLRPV